MRSTRQRACALAGIVVFGACTAPPSRDSRPGAESATPPSASAETDADARERETAETVEVAVERIRAATEAFKSLDAAVDAGYRRDVAQCIANPPAGGMGYHHQNDALLDERIELERPEILVYERMPDGEYRLNGVEYIVPFSVWPETKEPPAVLGQKLKPSPPLGIWYRHVWVWRENPSGLFADWNPLVKC